MTKFMDDFWQEKFMFGGEIKTRAEIYKYLQKIAPNQKCIDIYMLKLTKPIVPVAYKSTL